MRRTVCLLAGVLLCVLALGSDAPKEYDGAAEADDIQGTWELTGFECGPVREAPDYKGVVTFRGGTYTASYSDGETIRGSYRLDHARKPSHLDKRWTSGPYQGRTLECIYRVEGDTLRIAAPDHLEDVRRPQGFDHVIVAVYKRVK